MPRVLALYRAPVSARDQMANATPDQAKAGLDAWMAWAGKNGQAIVDLGSPVGDATSLPAGSAGAAEQSVAGFSILQGESMAAVTKALADHPHLMMPGGSIELHEFLPMPGM